jgi:glyoxylase I family protein
MGHPQTLIKTAREGGPSARSLRFPNPICAGIVLGPCTSQKDDGMFFLRRQLLRTLSFAFGSSVILSRNQLGLAAQTAAQPKIAPPPAGAAVRDGIAGGTEMEKVTGIGGFFFRAKDPKALALWYQQHLGILTIPTKDGETSWQQEAGATAFSAFPETSKYFGDPSKVWMLNFRVRDLEKMAAQLQAAGIEVKVDPESYPYGRFARLHDPEGNPIELWQPGEAHSSH